MNDKELDELLYKEMPSLSDKVLKDFPNDKDLEYEFSLEFENKMKLLIKKSYKKSHFYFFRKNFKIVSVIIIFISFYIFIGVPSSHADFENIIHKITKIYNTHLSIKYSNDMDDTFIKAKIPTYEPKDYKLIKQNTNNELCDIAYENSNHNVITYTCSVVHGNSILLDIEDAEINNIKINSKDAMFIEKDSRITLFYQDKERIFILDGDYYSKNQLISLKKELIRILRS
ncbi:MAG: DUF4367 domain-containing protein, partial [Terrisporobacter sp.]